MSNIDFKESYNQDWETVVEGVEKKYYELSRGKKECFCVLVLEKFTLSTPTLSLTRFLFWKGHMLIRI